MLALLATLAGALKALVQIASAFITARDRTAGQDLRRRADAYDKLKRAATARLGARNHAGDGAGADAGRLPDSRYRRD